MNKKQIEAIRIKHQPPSPLRSYTVKHCQESEQVLFYVSDKIYTLHQLEASHFRNVEGYLECFLIDEAEDLEHVKLILLRCHACNREESGENGPLSRLVQACISYTLKHHPSKLCIHLEDSFGVPRILKIFQREGFVFAQRPQTLLFSLLFLFIRSKPLEEEEEAEPEDYRLEPSANVS